MYSEHPVSTTHFGSVCVYLGHMWSVFIFSNHFIQIRLPEQHSYTFTHSFTPKDNLAQTYLDMFGAQDRTLYYETVR